MRNLGIDEIRQVNGAATDRISSWDAIGFNIGLLMGSGAAGFGLGNLAGGYYGYQFATSLGASTAAATLGAGAFAIVGGLAGVYLLTTVNTCLFTSQCGAFR